MGMPAPHSVLFEVDFGYACELRICRSFCSSMDDGTVCGRKAGARLPAASGRCIALCPCVVVQASKTVLAPNVGR